jgi:hypothetical protein
VKRLLLLSVLAFSASFTSAQQEEVGILSYVDLTAPPFHVELIELATFTRCQQQGIEVCEREGDTGVYRAPFQLEEQATRAEREIDAAWERFYNRTVNRIHGAINAFPPCWNPLAQCGAHIDWACVFSRQVRAVAESLAYYQPPYWQEVSTALLQQLPFSLWWEGPLPGQGAVLAAVMGGPQPQQYLDLATREAERDPRALTYYFQAPLFPTVPIPYAPHELGPGIVTLEEAKRGWQRATPLEYAQFGFASFWQARGEWRDTWFMRWPLVDGVLIPLPSIVSSICLIPTPPFIAVVPFVPVPTFVPQVPMAVYEYVTAPEGYVIPNLHGRPLWSLPDIDEFVGGVVGQATTLPQQPRFEQAAVEAMVRAAGVQAPAALQETLRLMGPVPCLHEGAPAWPGHLGPPPPPCPPGTPLPPQLGGSSR